MSSSFFKDLTSTTPSQQTQVSQIISPTSTIRQTTLINPSESESDEEPTTPTFNSNSNYFNQSFNNSSSDTLHQFITSSDPLPPPPPPPSTHFVSGASRRLPELQQQLHLNPESTPDLDQPNELDPLLPFTIDSSSSSSSQHHDPLPFNSDPTQLPLPFQSTSNSFRPKSQRKLGTFDGVYLPTILNIFNILYFLRFAFCVGQIGLLFTILLLLLSYLINTLTVFSLSAIATNGQVRGGGAYYLISRTLGPEFGGSIGILFCLSQALTVSMNIIGFVESLIEVIHSEFINHQTPNSFQSNHSIEQLSSVSPTLRYLMKSLTLFFVTVSCIGLGRTKIFSSMTRSMSTILLITLISILISFIKTKPFEDPTEDFIYTGFSIQTFKKNFYPSYYKRLENHTSSVLISPNFSNYQKVFGILFSSLSGILAGSSLSGELRKPSKSLPKGILWSLISVILIYLITLIALSFSCDRIGLSFFNSRNFLNLILYKISNYKVLCGFGILIGAIFSSIMGITVCGKILQAISRDGLIPILKPFFSQGSQIGDDPIYSILFCYLFCQIVLFYNINQISIHITTISLLIFACINLACFTLRIAGSPNFRPSFRLFSEWTALLGLVLAFVSMYAVDPVSASSSLIVMMVLFVVIHYSSPAKQWGEVTQSIIYHQVRKYLLRLDERKDNVKYWRPQVLLFTNDPRHDWNQIVFCNSLKKGGLYVLAHIIKSEFSSESIRELQEQQLNWLSLVDISNIKAFVDITLAPDERVGARHLLLTSGLGGMRPNICMLGFPTNLKWRRRGKLFNGTEETNEVNERRQKRMKRRSDSSLTVKGLIIESGPEVKIDCLGSLPTDSQRSETPIKPIDFVGIIEDSLSLNKSVGLTYGFEKLKLPSSISKPQSHQESNNRLHISTSLGGLASASFGGLAGNGTANVEEDGVKKKRWIDLWPILRDGESGWETYTMVLQLGMILSMVPSWRSQHTLRVTIFCELEEEIEEERRRMEKLLNDLRIRACLRVCVLGNGSIQTYECLVKGKEVDVITWSTLENALGGDTWWETLKFMRAQDGPYVGSSTNSNKRNPTNRESSNPSSTSEGNLKQKSVDRSLLTKHSQINNIRIKALHPFSRRPSQDNRSTSNYEGEAHLDKNHQNEEDEEEELMLEENDGDDDTIARAAYKKRSSKTPSTITTTTRDHSRSFEGLPDEPSTPKLSRVGLPILHQSGSSSTMNTTTTFDHHSLNLQNLSLLSPREMNMKFQDLSNPSSSSSSHSSKTNQNKTKRSTSLLKTPSSFKKIINRNRTKFNKPIIKRISKIDLSTEPNQNDSNNNNNNPVVELDFNSLPMRAQLVCLNELIKLNSPTADDHDEEEETVLIFTSLPPPDLGSSKSYESSSRYLDEIECFLDGLPPVLAIYAKQLTVTASL